MGNPQLSRAALPTPALSDRARLQMANTLQTTLMVDEVLRLFTNEARQIVSPFSLRYRNHADSVMYDEGRTYPNRISYDLDLHGASLGCITLSRSHAFSEDEIALFELMLCTLVYPLRNALMYERAIRSATIDPLTGIQNRTGLRQHLEHQVELCSRHGTPLYVYSAHTIRENFRRLDHALVGLDHRICFAMKANSNLAVLDLLARQGAGFDIVSGGELERVLAIGGNPAQVVGYLDGEGSRRKPDPKPIDIDSGIGERK
jgi:GGDEF domain-containing protein